MKLKQLIYLLTILLYTSPDVSASGFQQTVKGHVIDIDTGLPVSFAFIHVVEISRSATSDIEGKFELKNMPTGTFTIKAHRIGYRTQTVVVEITGNELDIEIELFASSLSLDDLTVTANHSLLDGSSVQGASKNIMGSELRQNLGPTLSQTLSNLPGFDQRTQGAAPGRPVIRGLGDERVLILKDGIRTGDVSAGSGDHAVSVDPVSADEIEIARGPAALAYGANALGGVINVVNNQIASSMPDDFSGSASLGSETNNSQLSGALRIGVPLNEKLVLNTNLSGKSALDTRSPDGQIRNSFYNSGDGQIGISYISDWGYIGASGGLFTTTYGIPPNPNGEPEGVNIEASKYNIDIKSEILLRNSTFQVLELLYSFKDYNHAEIERAGRGAIGTEFDLLTTNASIRTKHGRLGIFDKGSMGVWFEAEDLIVFGDDTPPSNSYKAAAYIIEEKDFGGFHLDLGLRYDYVLNRPDKDNPNADIGNVRRRTFSALSSSASLFYELGGGFTTGFSFLHSFRAPALEELYSEGPHLATFTFEIGNPELDSERGLAKEWSLRYTGRSLNGEVNLFHNGFSNFLFARNTGIRNNQRADLFNFQFDGSDAELYGFETVLELQLSKQWTLNTSISYTEGDRDVTALEALADNTDRSTRPLPQVPPLKSTIGLRYSNKYLETGLRIRVAADQTRTDQFESDTDGYTLLDSYFQYQIIRGKYFHTISLNANNLLNETYRNHLSLIRDVFPEPGISLSLLYRVYF